MTRLLRARPALTRLFIGCPVACHGNQGDSSSFAFGFQTDAKHNKLQGEHIPSNYCGWLRNPLRTTLKPWLKPLFVGIYVGETSDTRVGFRNHPQYQTGRGPIARLEIEGGSDINFAEFERTSDRSFDIDRSSQWDTQSKTRT